MLSGRRQMRMRMRRLHTPNTTPGAHTISACCNNQPTTH
jgi:hypothetical protein